MHLRGTPKSPTACQMVRFLSDWAGRGACPPRLGPPTSSGRCVRASRQVCASCAPSSVPAAKAGSTSPRTSAAPRPRRSDTLRLSDLRHCKFERPAGGNANRRGSHQSRGHPARSDAAGACRAAKGLLPALASLRLLTVQAQAQTTPLGGHPDGRFVHGR